MFAHDFAELGERRDLLVARHEDGAVAGVAVVAWEESERRRFAVLEDLAVEPELRSAGLGAAMLAEIEKAVAERAVDWLFLESGRRNDRAHLFFERHGFAEISRVFGKRIGR